MKRWITAVILGLNLCCAFTSYAQQRPYTLFNYGVKGGFSSAIYEVQELTVASVPITDYMTKSEISSFYTTFARFNIKRHYLQTELSYNISRYSVEFSSQQWASSAPPHELSSIKTKIIGLEVPLYYGYHILHEGPYGMSFYIGPKAKFILTDLSSHTLTNLPYKTSMESVSPLNFSIMVGLGINISRIFFDFSFEYGLQNISNGFTVTDVSGNSSQRDLIFDRRKNVLSFSVGLMF